MPRWPRCSAAPAARWATCWSAPSDRWSTWSRAHEHPTRGFPLAGLPFGAAPRSVPRRRAGRARSAARPPARPCMLPMRRSSGGDAGGARGAAAARDEARRDRRRRAHRRRVLLVSRGARTSAHPARTRHRPRARGLSGDPVELRQALTAIAIALLPAAAAAQVERFAVVVGNDQGQPPDAALLYAEADASRVAAMLQEVGGVRPENLVLLRGQDAGTVRRTLIAVNDRVRAAGRQAMLTVYYSGHADSGALHLGASSLELPELEQLVRGSAATFRLLILDACRSGALTRVKGGAPIPPFDIRLGERVAGEGAVFLTSSSASEDSQESDEIKGSFFTHALVSGLLGAADANGDGRVTLDETYRYAYDATLRASSRSMAGIQHPSFEYDVRGMGDVILATLDANAPTRAFLQFPEGRTWLVFQGSAEGSVLGEIGARDRARRLSVRAGRYFLRGRAPDVLLEGMVDALPGATVSVDESGFARTAYTRLVRKSGGAATAVASLEAEARVRSALVGENGACPGAALGVAVALQSFTLKPRVGWCRGGFSNPGIEATVDQYDLELSAVHVRDLHVISVELGLTMGGSLLVQRFRTQGMAPRRTTAALQLSPTVGITRGLGARSYLFVLGAASTYLLKSESSGTPGSSFGPSFAVRVSIGAGYRL